MSDDQLLACYAESGDDDAFRTLVERHASMVYGTALRKTGNHDTAQDISQTVFAALARKAPQLTSHTAISRWLFRATLYETAKALRSEATRHRHLDALAAQSDAVSPAAGTTPEPAAFAHLDDAVGALPERYRSIVLLRFYRGLSFREIARATGRSEPAARMQMQRALDKLTHLLKKRTPAAAALTAGALATALASRTSVEVPVALISNIATNTLSTTSAPTLITNTITAMTKAKLVPAAIVAAVAAVPLATTWNENRQLRDQLQSLSPAGAGTASATVDGHTDTTPGQDPHGGTPGAPGAAAGNGTAAASTPDRWTAALFEPDPVKRHRLISSLLDGLSPDNVNAVATAFTGAREKGGKFDQEFALFLRAWAEFDGPAALAHASEVAGLLDADRATLSAVGGWASQDPAAARDWVESVGDNHLRERLVYGLLDGWSIADFAAASAYAESRPRSNQRDKFVALLLERSVMAGGIPAAQDWFTTIDGSKHNELYKRNAFDSIVRTMLYRDPSSAAHWIATHAGEPYLDISHTVGDTAAKLAETDPAGAMAWLGTLDGLAERNAAAGADRALGTWALRDPDAASSWLAENESHPHYDTMAGRLARTLNRSTDDPAAGNAWATSIGDENARRQTQLAIARNQLNRHGNEPATIASLLDAGLPPGVVEEAHKNPHPQLHSYGFATGSNGDNAIRVYSTFTEQADMEIMARSEALRSVHLEVDQSQSLAPTPIELNFEVPTDAPATGRFIQLETPGE